MSAVNGSPVVPYVTGGIGGLTLFDTATLGITDTRTFLTGNVGGDVKWFNRTGRWGLRGDYRFVAVRSDDRAPASSAGRPGTAIVSTMGSWSM